MIRTPGILFALLVVAAVPSAKAGGTVNIKCGPNEDRVWVYESLTDFNVAAKLKCGDPVQIVERVKGYVKIETANGTEGYVLDTSFPKSALPPAPVEKPNDVESAAAAFAARRGVRAPDNSVAAPASTRSSAPASVASAAPSVVASAASPAVVTPAASSQPAPQTTVTLSAAAAPSEVSEPVRSAPTASPAPSAPAIAKNSAPVSSPGAVAPAVVVVEQPAATKVAYKTPEPAAAPKAAPTPQPAPVSATIAAAPRATPVVAVSAPAPAIATAAKAPAIVPVRTPVAPVSTASVSVPAPAPSDANDTSSMTIETTATSASLQPVADATPPRATIITVKPPAKRPVNPDGDVDSEVDALNTETANCSQYFSAYGLSANQYKWLAQNRQKAFPSVCPAPSPAQVDFVVIFTHDVPFYNATMPDAVHTDVNGFSDWTPLTTVDTAQISASDADKSHHEYVWVFHTNRGAFDPAKFSARRRPLYSKAETNMLGSRGGFRTVMDALTFIEQNATNR
jgi:Bacterial SH3 domain